MSNGPGRVRGGHVSCVISGRVSCALAAAIFALAVSCEQVENITLVNDTDCEIQIVYYNLTVAKTEDIVFTPGESKVLSLAGVASGTSIEKTRDILRELVVVRLLANRELRLVFRGDEAVDRFLRALEKVNEIWTIRLSAVF